MTGFPISGFSLGKIHPAACCANDNHQFSGAGFANILSKLEARADLTLDDLIAQFFDDHIDRAFHQARGAGRREDAEIAVSLGAILLAAPRTHAQDGGVKPVNKGPIKIVVIPKGTTHSFWKSVEAGARQAGTELGVEVATDYVGRNAAQALQVYKSTLAHQEAGAIAVEMEVVPDRIAAESPGLADERLVDLNLDAVDRTGEHADAERQPDGVGDDADLD